MSYCIITLINVDEVHFGGYLVLSCNFLFLYNNIYIYNTNDKNGRMYNHTFKTIVWPLKNANRIKTIIELINATKKHSQIYNQMLVIIHQLTF